MEIQLIDCDFTRHGEAVRAILNHAILHTTSLYDYEPRSLAVVQDWFEQRTGVGLPIVGAVSPVGELLGFASYGPFRQQAAYQYTVEHSVYVRHDAQGRGLGRALLEALLARAGGAGYKCMIGVIDEDNRASIALHQRLGFEQVGRLPAVGFKFERWLNVVLYQRLLR